MGGLPHNAPLLADLGWRTNDNDIDDFGDWKGITPWDAIGAFCDGWPTEFENETFDTCSNVYEMISSTQC